MNYEMKVGQFAGPLDKLLELIEARQMEITQISLARVTDDFLQYLKTMTAAKIDLRLVADFITVASRLILLKSKSLLPDLSLTGEEEAEVGDLERRLKLYRELKPAIKFMAKLWGNGRAEFSRPYFFSSRGSLSTGEAFGFFYPGQGLSEKNMAGALNGLFESFGDFILETKTVKEKIISIEEKMAEIVGRLKSGGESSFRTLSSAKSRSEIVAIFLAILHLAREQLIFLEQGERFSDIIIKNMNTNSG